MTALTTYGQAYIQVYSPAEREKSNNNVVLTEIDRLFSALRNPRAPKRIVRRERDSLRSFLLTSFSMKRRFLSKREEAESLLKCLARAIGRLRPKTVVTWKGENNKRDGPKRNLQDGKWGERTPAPSFLFFYSILAQGERDSKETSR